jgi:DNA-binding transcriptional MerR regulator
MGVIEVGDPGPTAGVYTISVAAELAGVAVRSLRLYEQHGLLRPGRTSGGTRRYSQDDLRRLRRISELVADGVNLTGIGKILDLEQDTHELRTDNTALRADNSRLRDAQENPPDRAAPDPEREPTRRRSPPRHTPTDQHRNQSSRPG